MVNGRTLQDLHYIAKHAPGMLTAEDRRAIYQDDRRYHDEAARKAARTSWPAWMPAPAVMARAICLGIMLACGTYTLLLLLMAAPLVCRGWL